MLDIKLQVNSSEKEVRALLDMLIEFLQDEEFDIDKHFVLIKTKKEKGRERYSTEYTMHELEYLAEDIVECLKSLSIQDYSETRVDKDNIHPPLLFVFGKYIGGRLVYIKLKIKELPIRHVLCVSFHFAEEEMKFPFA